MRRSNAAGSSLNAHGKSERKTPDSNDSTWPPTYVSDSTRRPSFRNTAGSFCLFGQTTPARNASTISRLSHNVPEPFRKTSSALFGITVQSEKMNKFT